MRKLFLPIICLLILAFVSSTGARMCLPILAGQPAAGGSCQAADKDAETNQDDYESFGYLDSNKYRGGAFVTSAAYDLCEVEVYLLKVGSPNFTFQLKLYSDDGTDPDSVLATAAETIDADVDLTTGYAWYTFTFSNYSLSNATKYWLILVADGYHDASNLVRIGHYDAGADTGRSVITAGVSWTTTTDSMISFKTHSYE